MKCQLALVAVVAVSANAANPFQATQCVQHVSFMSAAGAALDNTFTLTEIHTTGLSSVVPSEASCVDEAVPKRSSFYINAHAVAYRNTSTQELTLMEDLCYAKVASGLQPDLEYLNKCVQVGQERGLVEAFKLCNSMEGCQAVSLSQSPQMPPYQACFFGKVTGFKAKKASFPTKLFIKQESCGKLKKFYPYLQYPARSAPVSKAVQTFSATSQYSADECSSMCDMLGTVCSGFQMQDDICVALIANINSEKSTQPLPNGVAFRKAFSEADTLTACEMGTGPCVDDEETGGLGVGVIAAIASAGALLVAGTAFFAARKLRGSSGSAFDEADMEGKNSVIAPRKSISSGSSAPSVESENPCFLSTEIEH